MMLESHPSQMSWRSRAGTSAALGGVHAGTAARSPRAEGDPGAVAGLIVMFRRFASSGSGRARARSKRRSDLGEDEPHLEHREARAEAAPAAAAEGIQV